MEYRVIPFHPTVTDKSTSVQASAELQTVLNKELANGWKFKSLQSMTLDVKPTGCAGLLSKKSSTVNMQLIVLEK